MTETKYGWAAQTECYDPTEDPKPDAALGFLDAQLIEIAKTEAAAREEKAKYHRIKNSVLSLTNVRLEQIYVETAKELNKRMDIRFPPVREEAPGPSVAVGCGFEPL